MSDHAKGEPEGQPHISLSDPDPEFAALFTGAPFPSGGFFSTKGSFDALRTRHAAIEKEGCDSIPTLGTTELVRTIPMRDGYESEIRIIRPSVPEGGSPVIVLIYGGGYLVGTNMQLVPFARALSVLYNATAITVSYRLAPEHPFPTAPEDVWDSLKWISEHAPALGADPCKGFILGGVSAGGHLTTLTAQRAIKEKLSPPITGIWVAVPITALTEEDIPVQYRAQWVSRTENEYAPILDVADINAARDNYQPIERSDQFSPFLDTRIASQLPSAYIQVAGLDPLRDDGLIYERYLRDNGVKTRLDVYPGVPHCHHAFFPKLESSKKFRRDMTLGVGWLLGKEITDDEVRRVAGDVLGLVRN